MSIEEKLMSIDFSKFSKVQDSLLQQINNRRRLESEIMADDELEEVAAAGTQPIIKKYETNIKK